MGGDEEQSEGQGGEVGELQRAGGEEADAWPGTGGGEQLRRCFQRCWWREAGKLVVAAEGGGREIDQTAAVEARLRGGSQ